MTLFVGQAGRVKRQYASQVAGFAAVTIAAAALFGWWTGLPILSSRGADFPPLRPLGALCLAALGVALVHPGKESRLPLAFGVAVAGLTALGLALVLFNVDLGIVSRWLVPSAAVPGLGTATFRAASAGTVALGLAGGSLALSRFEPHRFTATILAGIAGAIAVFALLGYLTGVDTLYGSVSVNSPPLPTAAGLLCIASGIISRIGTMPVLRKSWPLRHLLVMLGWAPGSQKVTRSPQNICIDIGSAGASVPTAGPFHLRALTIANALGSCPKVQILLCWLPVLLVGFDDLRATEIAQ